MNPRNRTLSVLLAAVAVLALSLAGTAHAASASPSGVVNINSATEAQLTLLPGVGPSKARAILQYRQSHPFKTAGELVKVKGIGKKLMRKLESFVTVDGKTTIRAPAKKKSRKRSRK